MSNCHKTITLRFEGLEPPEEWLTIGGPVLKVAGSSKIMTVTEVDTPPSVAGAGAAATPPPRTLGQVLDLTMQLSRRDQTALMGSLQAHLGSRGFQGAPSGGGNPSQRGRSRTRGRGTVSAPSPRATSTMSRSATVVRSPAYRAAESAVRAAADALRAHCHLNNIPKGTVPEGSSQLARTYGRLAGALQAAKDNFHSLKESEAATRATGSGGAAA
jgi:hypothetical protein